MKRNFVFLFFIFLNFNLFSQTYSTPGNGETYTLEALSDMSEGVLSFSDNAYLLQGELTIHEADVFSIETNALVRCGAGARIVINGKALIAPPEKVVFVSADSLVSENAFIGLYLTEDGNNSVFRNVHIRYGGGLKIWGATDVVIENCEFYRNYYVYDNGSAALVLSNCNPLVKRCRFIENERSGISSPANGAVAPTIDGCYFYRNTTGNGNYPQINIGNGAEGDTVRIINNYVEGFYTNAGGIAVSTLAGGSIVARIENNHVVNNRYGIAGTGNDIRIIAKNNYLIDNNLETNPMNGGSGFNMYATNTTSHLYASGNYVTGSLWGVTLVGAATGNFGNLDATGAAYNEGLNQIVENGNGGEMYNFYNNTANPVSIQNNYWGVDTPEEAESVIFHAFDDPSLGEADFLPLWIPDNNCFPTQNLTGKVLDDGSVKLHWEAPLAGPLGPPNIYAVYLDGYLLTELPADEFMYEHIPFIVKQEVPVVYEIVARYETCDSEPVSVELSVPVGIKDYENDIKIYPVIRNNTLYIEAQNINSIQLVNMLGQIVYDKKMKSDFAQIDLSVFQSGVYILAVQANNQIRTQRIFVSK